MICAIAPWPHQILSKKCDPVGSGGDLKVLCENLRDTALSISPNGMISLSAPQIGYPVRVFYIGPGLTSGAGELTFVNPVVLSHGEMLQQVTEQCASVPGIEMLIQRYLSIRIEAKNVNGDSFVVPSAGILAQAIQHELNHLDGKTLMECTNRVKRKYLGQKLKMKYQGHQGMMVRFTPKDMVVEK